MAVFVPTVPVHPLFLLADFHGRQRRDVHIATAHGGHDDHAVRLERVRLGAHGQLLREHLQTEPGHGVDTIECVAWWSFRYAGVSIDEYLSL